MKIAASKLLLGVSLVTYGYVLRAHIFGGTDKVSAATASSGGKELTAADVNPSITLKLARDPFAGGNIVNSRPATMPTTTTASTQPTTLPTTQAATQPTTMPVVKVPVKLEGIVFGPSGRAAIINGQSVKLGETVRLQPGGDRIVAKDIGVDSVLVQLGDQKLRLHLPKPPTDEILSAPPTAVAQTPSKTKPAKPPGRQTGVATVREP